MNKAKRFLPPGKTCNSKTSGKEGLRILCEVGSIDFLDHLGIIVDWGSDHKLIQIIPNILLFRKHEIIPWWPWVAIEFGFQCVKSSLDAIRWCQCSNSLRYT